MTRILTGLLLSLCLLAPIASQAAEETQPNRATVEGWVHDYLLENPEVILEAMQVLQNRQAALEARKARDTIATMDEMFRDDPLTYVAGNPDGDITIYEFFDYKCSFCKRALDTVLTLLEEDKNIRFVMLEFPILSEESVLAAHAAMASIEQGNYFEFHKALLHAKGTLNQGRIVEIASAHGIDGTKLLKRMDDEDIKDALIRNQQLAAALDISGTPGFVVGSQLIKGALPIEHFRAAIAEQRAAAND